MQDECRVYKDSYMTSDGSCFKKYLLEVGLTQNRGTMALQLLTTVDLFYFDHVGRPTRIVIRCIWLRARSHIWLHTTLEGP
jgi:hypothetical protein